MGGVVSREIDKMLVRFCDDLIMKGTLKRQVGEVIVYRVFLYRRGVGACTHVERIV